MTQRKKTTFELATRRATSAESEQEQRVRVEAYDAFFAARDSGASPGDLFDIAYGAGLTSRGHIKRDREHVVQTSAADARKLQEFLNHPNGCCILGQDGRAVIEAVEDGGVLVRTEPFRV